jgi:hypothetical protein
MAGAVKITLINFLLQMRVSPKFMSGQNTNKQNITIAELYPELTKEQREEAAYYLARYVDVVQRIFERVNNLTDSGERPTMPMNQIP